MCCIERIESGKWAKIRFSSVDFLFSDNLLNSWSVNVVLMERQEAEDNFGPIHESLTN